MFFYDFLVEPFISKVLVVAAIAFASNYLRDVSHAIALPVRQVAGSAPEN